MALVIILLWTLLQNSVWIDGAVQQYDMGELCGTTVSMDFDNIYGLKVLMYMTSQLIATGSCRLVIDRNSAMEQLHFYFSDADLSDCSQMSLYIYEGDSSQNMDQYSYQPTMCGQTTSKSINVDYTTSKRYLALELTWNIATSFRGSVFTMLANTYDCGDSCTTKDKCDNGICLHSNLIKQPSYNFCGGSTLSCAADPEDSLDDSFSSIGTIVGVVFTTIIFLVFTVCAFCMFRKFNDRHFGGSSDSCCDCIESICECVCGCLRGLKDCLADSCTIANKCDNGICLHSSLVTKPSYNFCGGSTLSCTADSGDSSDSSVTGVATTVGSVISTVIFVVFVICGFCMVRNFHNRHFSGGSNSFCECVDCVCNGLSACLRGIRDCLAACFGGIKDGITACCGAIKDKLTTCCGSIKDSLDECTCLGEEEAPPPPVATATATPTATAVVMTEMATNTSDIDDDSSVSDDEGGASGFDPSSAPPSYTVAMASTPATPSAPPQTHPSAPPSYDAATETTEPPEYDMVMANKTLYGAKKYKK